MISSDSSRVSICSRLYSNTDLDPFPDPELLEILATAALTKQTRTEIPNDDA